MVKLLLITLATTTLIAGLSLPPARQAEENVALIEGKGRPILLGRMIVKATALPEIDG